MFNSVVNFGKFEETYCSYAMTYKSHTVSDGPFSQLCSDNEPTLQSHSPVCSCREGGGGHWGLLCVSLSLSLAYSCVPTIRLLLYCSVFLQLRCVLTVEPVSVLLYSRFVCPCQGTCEAFVFWGLAFSYCMLMKWCCLFYFLHPSLLLCWDREAIVCGIVFELCFHLRSGSET